MDMNKFYFILENGEPVVVSMEQCFEWIASDTDFSKRRVARTPVGDYEVSTVFLTFNHGFKPGPPILFESMVFQGDVAFPDTLQRYETLEDAMLGHERIVAAVKAGDLPPPT